MGLVPAPSASSGRIPLVLVKGDPKATLMMGDVLHGDLPRAETASAPITPLPSGPHLPVGRGRSLERKSVDINARRHPEVCLPKDECKPEGDSVRRPGNFRPREF